MANDPKVSARHLTMIVRERNTLAVEHVVENHEAGLLYVEGRLVERGRSTDEVFDHLFDAGNTRQRFSVRLASPTWVFDVSSRIVRTAPVVALYLPITSVAPPFPVEPT